MTTSRSHLPRSEVSLALSAWRQAAGCAALSTSLEERAVGWLREVWQAGATHIPLPFAIDLGAVLLFGRSFRFRSVDADQASEPVGVEVNAEDASTLRRFQRFRLGYQDRVISKWLIEPSLQDLHVHIAGLDENEQDRAISHAIVLSLGKRLFDVDGLVVGNAAFLRAPKRSTSEAEPEPFSKAEAELPAAPADWLGWVEETLQPSIAVLASSSTLTPEDAWEIRHLDRLPTESTRLALRQIHHVASQIGPLAANSALTLRQRAREVPIEKEDADAYPTGGFDAISTQGTFENLVRSEIAYVGEGTSGEAASGALGIDLFDVRFAENELLFYTRDESPVLDAFRTLTVTIDEPERLRTKAPGASAQTQVLSLGLSLALQADMIRAFGAAASKTTIRLHCRSESDQVAAREDAALLELSLRSEIKHLRATLVTTHADGSSPSDAPGVVFSLRPRPTDAQAFAWIRVGADEWTWEDKEHAVSFVSSPTSELRQLADAILFSVAAPGRGPQ